MGQNVTWLKKAFYSEDMTNGRVTITLIYLIVFLVLYDLRTWVHQSFMNDGVNGWILEALHCFLSECYIVSYFFLAQYKDSFN
jgi:hypothetical protein